MSNKSLIYLVCMVCSFIFVLFMIFPAGAEGLYPLTTVVCACDRIEDIVTCADFNGNLWMFYGVEDWQIGDIASLIMDPNNSETIHDDRIVSIKYDGYLETIPFEYWMMAH